MSCMKHNRKLKNETKSETAEVKQMADTERHSKKMATYLDVAACRVLWLLWLLLWDQECCLEGQNTALKNFGFMEEKKLKERWCGGEMCENNKGI